MQIHISVSEYQIQNGKFKAQWKSSEENTCEDHRSCIKLDWSGQKLRITETLADIYDN